ncbi:hypothetical protein BaRGS_00036054 [Batillaria attramentaria]|uniref:Secreted protein n=1 Tax=Batillaria attramentaria TaxID=370345 RepID=A0ABD0JD49_9CAEN
MWWEASFCLARASCCCSIAAPFHSARSARGWSTERSEVAWNSTTVGKQFFRPWRNNKRKKSPVLHVFDVPSVVITPPSPNVTPRGGENDSIGSSGDLVRNIVVNSDAASSGQDKTCADTHNSGDVFNETSLPPDLPEGGGHLWEEIRHRASVLPPVAVHPLGIVRLEGEAPPTGCDGHKKPAQQRSVLSLTDAER